MDLRSVLLSTVGVLVGFAGHAAWSSAHPGPELVQKRPVERTEVSVGAAPPACTTDWGAMRDEVKQAVRDVLQETNGAWARGSAAGRGDAGSGASPGVEVKETDDNRQAREAEGALLDAAIRSGHWTGADVMKLRTLIPRMAPADRPKALAAISKSINDGQLRVDAVPPF